MSSDQKNFKAAWHHSHDLAWDDSAEDEAFQAYDEDEVENMLAPPADGQGDEGDDVEMATSPRPVFSRFEFLGQLGQHLSPIFAPLLLGGITFLIILPLVLSGHAYATGRLAAIGLGFFAIAVLQCMMLYYAGSNNVYWTLSIIGGFFLFLLAGCFALFGPIWTLIFFVVLVIISFIIARLYMRPVAEGTVDIVYAFGKYRRTLFPGLNFLLPWEWIDVHLQTRERQWTSPEQKVAISRDEDVHLKAMISYQLVPEDAYLAITQVENWEESLHSLFEAMLQTASNQLTPDDFITWQQSLRSIQSTAPLNHAGMTEEARWERINDMLFQRMRDRVAMWGVLINWVHIRDITVTPRTSTLDSSKMASLRPSAPLVEAATSSQPPRPPQQQMKLESDTNPGGSTSTTLKMPNPLAQPQPAATSPTVGGKIPKEKALIYAYQQIKDGKITSPDTIRRVAMDFQRIASDPDASHNVSFDAARAAEVLFTQAAKFEELARNELQFSGGFHYNEADQYDDDSMATPLSPVWPSRPPTDDNLMAGG